MNALDLNWKLIFFMGVLYMIFSFVFMWSPITSTISMNFLLDGV